MELFEKIKQAIHNKFFREVSCSNCGEKGKVMSYRKLIDDSLLCKTCMYRIPKRLKDWVKNGTLDIYKQAAFFGDRTKIEYKPIFNCDAGYHLFEVDAQHLLFRLFDEGDLILPLSCIDYYDFEFRGEELKEGFISDKVKGDVYVTISTSNPPVSYTTGVAFGVKGKAHKQGIIGNTYVYDDPKDLKEFVQKFDELVEKAKREQQEAIAAAQQQAREAAEAAAAARAAEEARFEV